MKRLNVKRTSNAELSANWGFITNFEGEIFIRCNAKGIVNWEKAPCYYLSEILQRGNTRIIEGPSKVENIIEQLRGNEKHIQTIFMQGGCYQFHLFLKTLFPEAKPYLHEDNDHVITKINNEYFDIKGKIKDKFFSLYRPLPKEKLEMVRSWSFSKNWKLKTTYECEACGEPVCI